ncbi:hypothetical protein T265_09445 [Opisthorchis viverrini]|uniref:Uncharacterized protein n=1 Tax=Opisthorchis viverrini TaxID=6198 RepID=A0A075A4X1_OPIVI|nr:hypothetical protein T265_09445 [Opisthorchis viverrini]KER22469.1 hypothetical protein T265_09445 [Opisthorchis viverrini]
MGSLHARTGPPTSNPVPSRLNGTRRWENGWAFLFSQVTRLGGGAPSPTRIPFGVVVISQWQVDDTIDSS